MEKWAVRCERQKVGLRGVLQFSNKFTQQNTAEPDNKEGFTQSSADRTWLMRELRVRSHCGKCRVERSRVSTEGYGVIGVRGWVVDS